MGEPETEIRLDGNTGQDVSGVNEAGVNGDGGNELGVKRDGWNELGVNGDGRNEPGVTGDGENAFEMDMEIDEDLVSMKSPVGNPDQWARAGGKSEAGVVMVTSSRRESSNGSGAAGRYSFGEDSSSDTEAPEGERRGHVEDPEPQIASGNGGLEEGSGESSAGGVALAGHVERSGPQVVGARFAKLLDQANAEEASETKSPKPEAIESESSGEEPLTPPTGAIPSRSSQEEDLQSEEHGQASVGQSGGIPPVEARDTEFRSLAAHSGGSPPVEERNAEFRSPVARSGGIPDRNEEWRVHENPIAAPDAGRASLSPGWEASETTFDKDTLRRMSAGEVSSPAPPEGLGIWVKGDRSEGLGLEAGLREGSEGQGASVPEETGDEDPEKREGLLSDEEAEGEEERSGVQELETKVGSENEAGLEGSEGALPGLEPAAQASDADAAERNGVTDSAGRHEDLNSAEGSGARDVRNEEHRTQGTAERERNPETEGGADEESEAGASAVGDPAVGDTGGRSEGPVEENSAELVKGEFYQVEDCSGESDDKPALEGGREVERDGEANVENRALQSGAHVADETSDVTLADERPESQPSTLSSDVRTGDDITSPVEEESTLGYAPRVVESQDEEKSTVTRSAETGASPPKVKKRVTFSEHNQYQMIEPNPSPEERALMRSDAPERLSFGKWVRFAGRAAEKGVRNTVIAIAAAEVGTVLWVVTRGLWDAYCAPTINVPLPS